MKNAIFAITLAALQANILARDVSVTATLVSHTPRRRVLAGLTQIGPRSKWGGKNA
jgi:hypothetical protein